MNWEIRRIPLMPLVKISFIVYLLISLVGMLLYGLFLSSMAGLISSLIEEDFGAVLPLTGGALIFGGLVMSVIMAVIYTFFTFLAGVVYNAVASMVGGLEVELEPANGPSELANYVHPHLPRPPVPRDPVTPPPPELVQQAPPPPQPVPQAPPSPQQSAPAAETDTGHERYMPSGGSESGETGWGWGDRGEQDKKDQD